MNKYLKLIIVAAIATAVVTAYNFVFAPMFGLPDLQRTRFIASVFNTGLTQGWFINLAIGIIFTFLYVKLFRRAVLKVPSLFSGLLFGFFTFLIIQFFYTLFVHDLPRPADYLQSGDFMGKLILNSLIANLIFGLIVGMATGNQKTTERS
jgi:uncharacterized membrane protein YeaQ/YmgE (transglycosylase-associated protein family)